MKTKIWLIIATVLLIVGLTTFALVMKEYNWDFLRFNTVKYELNTYEIDEDFGSISISTDTADIMFALSDSEKCRVECYEQEKEKHSVGVTEGTLIIKLTDSKAWYDNIGIGFSEPRIKIYLPKEQYTALFIDESTGDIEIPRDFLFESIDISLSTGDVYFYASASDSLKIKASTGDIRLENVTAKELSLSTSTGDITLSGVVCSGDVSIGVTTGKVSLSNVECSNFASKGDTGDIYLNRVNVKEKLKINRDTGDVSFDASDAKEILIETDTGDVRGSLLTEKVFLISTDTGKIEVPKTTKGGACQITTSTGDIKISLD